MLRKEVERGWLKGRWRPDHRAFLALLRIRAFAPLGNEGALRILRRKTKWARSVLWLTLLRWIQLSRAQCDRI